MPWANGLGLTFIEMKARCGGIAVMQKDAAAFVRGRLQLSAGFRESRSEWIGLSSLDNRALSVAEVRAFLEANRGGETWEGPACAESRDEWYFTPSGKAAACNGRRVLIYTAAAAEARRAPVKP